MKSIIVREYLQSLAERDELDYLFPILLDVMGFKIISTPKQTKGLPQYGKDVVAVGVDTKDGIKKRYFFELKGGQDKNVTTSNYSKTDGIRESIIEAKDRPFKDSSNPDFNTLPVKIVLVHNGEIHASVKETFDGFIEKEFPEKNFERWDIFELTSLFSEHLFNEYLLTDEESVKNFKKVLVLINAPGNDLSDFFHLINSICEKAGKSSELGERKKTLFFETLNLVSFIVYSYSAESKNLEPAKSCLSFSCARFWSWILDNELQQDKQVIGFYKKHMAILLNLLREYFSKTLPVAKLENGLWSQRGGRYEQIGYPQRTFEYLSYLLVFFELLDDFDNDRTNYLQPEKSSILGEILNHNRSATRPLLDNHSIPISLILCFLIKNNHLSEAKIFIRNLTDSIKLSYKMNHRLPDGRNHLDSVIRLMVTGKKSIYYEDKTSHLFGMIFEFIAILEMETEYSSFREFVIAAEVDIALFIPYTDTQLVDDFPEHKASHECLFFSRQLAREGYQSEIVLEEEFSKFRSKVLARDEFSYSYKTSDVGFNSLLYLAHIVFKTPLFTHFWRPIEKAKTFQ